MKLKRKTIALLLLAFFVCLLSVGILVVLTVSGTIEFSGYPGETKQCYRYSLLEDEAVILSCYDKKSGGKLIHVKKIDGHWECVQTIDHLEDIVGDYKLSEVVHNTNWLCISTYRAIFEKEKKKQRVFLFKQEAGQWQYVDFIEGGTGKISDIELLSDNRLLFSQYTEEMGVHCYDLNASPPKLTQVIQREHRDGDEGLFGTKFHVVEDTLYIFDTASYFFPEEEKKYNLSKDDYGVLSSVEGKHYQIQTYTSVLSYHYSGAEWVFECDFYPLLPHPKGNALRKNEKFRSAHTSEFYYPLVEFWNCKPQATSRKAYLVAAHQFYVFEQNDDDEWQYSHRFSPPNFYMMPLPSASRIIRSQCDPVKIGEKYTLAVRDDATFAVFKTDELEKWQALWGEFFVSENIASRWPNGETIVIRTALLKVIPFSFAIIPRQLNLVENFSEEGLRFTKLTIQQAHKKFFGLMPRITTASNLVPLSKN